MRRYAGNKYDIYNRRKKKNKRGKRSREGINMRNMPTRKPLCILITLFTCFIILSYTFSNEEKRADIPTGIGSLLQTVFVTICGGYFATSAYETGKSMSISERDNWEEVVGEETGARVEEERGERGEGGGVQIKNGRAEE